MREGRAFFTDRYGPQEVREAHRELAEVTLSWTKLMRSPGPRRSTVPCAPPGEAVGPLAPLAFPHAKDGVPLVSARALLWPGCAPHAGGLAPPVSVAGALGVAAVARPAPMGCTCAPPLVPLVPSLLGSPGGSLGVPLPLPSLWPTVSDLRCVRLIASRPPSWFVLPVCLSLLASPPCLSGDLMGRAVSVGHGSLPTSPCGSASARTTAAGIRCCPVPRRPRSLGTGLAGLPPHLGRTASRRLPLLCSSSWASSSPPTRIVIGIATAIASHNRSARLGFCIWGCCHSHPPRL
jgi:hypothetical protein